MSRTRTNVWCIQVSRTPAAAGEPLWLPHSGCSSRLLALVDVKTGQGMQFGQETDQVLQAAARRWMCLPLKNADLFNRGDQSFCQCGMTLIISRPLRDQQVSTMPWLVRSAVNLATSRDALTRRQIGTVLDSSDQEIKSLLCVRRNQLELWER
jgi:hypothetical protein